MQEACNNALSEVYALKNHSPGIWDSPAHQSDILLMLSGVSLYCVAAF